MNDSIETGKQRIKRYEEECNQMLNDLFKYNADNKSCIEMLREYQCLHYAFLYRLKNSGYTDTEIKDCLWGMSALLQARINRLNQENLNGNDEPDVDNMSLEEMKEAWSSQFDKMIISMVATQLIIGYIQIFHRVMDFDVMINKIKERLKENPEFDDRLLIKAINKLNIEGYDYDLCCTREEARKLEKLMGLEFLEFDVLMGRREKETDTADRIKADYETIEIKFNVIE